MSKAVDSWLSPPLNLKLSSQEVDIWRIHIETDDFMVKKLQPLLSTYEPIFSELSTQRSQLFYIC
ncbi:hypothetical protein CAL7716_029420 [Calothrix sp. PCC 7716]|nr:hypothetical protein CAL7716_029420 [Calothrix sp. PCC 7716]